MHVQYHRVQLKGPNMEDSAVKTRQTWAQQGLNTEKFFCFFLEEGYNSKFLNMPKAWTGCSANKHTDNLHTVPPYVNPHHHIRWKLDSWLDSFYLKSHQTYYIHIPPTPSHVCNAKKLAWLRGKFSIWAVVLGCRLPEVALSEDLTQQGRSLSNAW